MEVVLTALIVVAGMSFQSWILTKKPKQVKAIPVEHEVQEIDEDEKKKREKQMKALKQMASMNVTDQLRMMREQRTEAK